jgi:uracil-DNA glycosylase
LAEEFEKPYYQQLRQKQLAEYQTKVTYPDQHGTFNALHYTSYKNTKVVIIGQDPYHGPEQALGLSFSL